MNVNELIKLAAVEQRTQRELANKLGVHEDMVSHWKRGRMKPTAGQIAALAECANLPILETVAEIEADLDERNSEIWKRALRALQSAGVAAAITGLLVTGERAETALYKTESCSQIAHMLL
jgi:transcriptional regulator with XRE-family HTH domain